MNENVKKRWRIVNRDEEEKVHRVVGRHGNKIINLLHGKTWQQSKSEFWEPLNSIVYWSQNWGTWHENLIASNLKPARLRCRNEFSLMEMFFLYLNSLSAGEQWQSLVRCYLLNKRISADGISFKFMNKRCHIMSRVCLLQTAVAVFHDEGEVVELRKILNRWWFELKRNL